MTKDNDDIISSDNPLSEDQRRTLANLLDMIIPPSEDGRMPGASEVDVLGYIRDNRSDSIALIVAGLTALDELSDTRHGEGFAALAGSDRQTLVDELQKDQAGFFQNLVSSTVICYYQHDRVLEALGLEARPPFPEGYEVEPGDLSLLDPVRARGKLYRE
ncbi:MAG: gluconate 2-dehydrogenase subunit 3 family protein [Pseudomonadales bacterium]|jgi:hypothetical protein|nr:gluconate 2-dehydrogenase subunit 3 family protein [Pseudomonadales bacterium]MDP7597256.1 gluconate 2-dehydrogenase subunit 3 family protein [Pseudomonadales bacterium]HJN52032.1 gluconate 2-dehydrogenase subunit 3 family protein [Pseudomonadales bacterium]|tara:strand:- start:1605 stop:2084 length:480 start_codon:yes stop_codon:yes gene_type:complete